MGSFSPSIENIGKIFNEFEKCGFDKDLWVLSTYTRITKNAIYEAGARYRSQITPVILIPANSVTPIIPANRIAKLLLVTKKNTKILETGNRFTTLKQQKFDAKLGLELAAIPPEESPSVIQEFKTYFSNTQNGWDQFLEYRKQKQVAESQQRKLVQHRIRLQERQAKQQMKHQLREFEETGGYEAIQEDEIERVRKKPCLRKKWQK